MLRTDWFRVLSRVLKLSTDEGETSKKWDTEADA